MFSPLDRHSTIGLGLESFLGDFRRPEASAAGRSTPEYSSTLASRLSHEQGQGQEQTLARIR